MLIEKHMKNSEIPNNLFTLQEIKTNEKQSHLKEVTNKV